jgi:D-arabinose 1-dehydrogenase-like Zn-dependent alcohol dehydrogenase
MIRPHLGDARFVKQARIIVTHYGGPDALQVVEEECPEPKPCEGRVNVLAAGVSMPDVLAAGVSMPDVLAREGVPPETSRVPDTPGCEVVGIGGQIGERASGFELSQTVAAMPISGCYAQHVCLPQRKFIPVPAGLDAAEAVAVVFELHDGFPDAASFGEGKAGASGADSPRLGWRRDCVAAAGAARQRGNVRSVFRAGGGGN